VRSDSDKALSVADRGDWSGKGFTYVTMSLSLSEVKFSFFVNKHPEGQPTPNSTKKD
jgi:hypothetical protein